MDERRAVQAHEAAAYGGPGWRPRMRAHAEELGDLWAACGLDSEWRPLRKVLLSPPGAALAVGEPDANLYLDRPDPARAAEEHTALAEAYRRAGVTVIETREAPDTPNRMFAADLFAMTPQGAILARPAGAARAGEEVAVAAALAGARVPILRTLTGRAVFEGADLMWLDRGTALLGLGLRTNQEAARQIGALLADLGAELLAVDMPAGTMHLMGMLRIVDRDLALAWPARTPFRAVEALRGRGFRVAFLPEEVVGEAERGKAFNFVTLGPRRILMPAGNVAARRFYEGLGIDVVETPMAELAKAAGAVGCLTGIVAREMAAEAGA